MKKNNKIRFICIMFLCIYISSNVCAAEMIDMEKTGSIVVAMSGEDEEISGGSLTIYKVAEITESKESYVFAYVEEWESCPQQLEGLQSPETAEALYQYAVEQEIQGFTKKIEEGTAPREKQGEEFTLAPMLSKEIANIKWNEMTAVQIKNLVRGLNPIMGALTNYEDKKIKFWKVEAITNNEFNKRFPENKIEQNKPGIILISNPKIGLYLSTKE